jgi:hypothetical protein
MKSNPFTPTFGKEPAYFAGRDKIIEDIIEGLENGPGDPNRSTILIGPRGSGKTVLLSRIAKEAEQIGFISATVTATVGMLDEILEQVIDNGAELLPKGSKSRMTGLSVYGTGFSREFIQAKTPSWRHKMAGLLDILNERGVGVIITVDELNAETDEMIRLAIAYQHFVREDRNVAMIMAGLPGKISQVFQHKIASFMRKSFQHHLGQIDIREVRVALEKTIEAAGRTIGKGALDTTAKYTGGFPFLIQLAGYHVWRQSPDSKTISLADAKYGIVCAEADMDKMILETTLRELSPKDISFLIAMTEDDTESRMGDIAERIGASPSLAGQYRLRLLDQGLITDAGYGRVKFEMPFLRGYLIKTYSDRSN